MRKITAGLKEIPKVGDMLQNEITIFVGHVTHFNRGGLECRPWNWVPQNKSTLCRDDWKLVLAVVVDQVTDTFKHTVFSPNLKQTRLKHFI